MFKGNEIREAYLAWRTHRTCRAINGPDGTTCVLPNGHRVPHWNYMSGWEHRTLTPPDEPDHEPEYWHEHGEWIDHRHWN